VSQVTQTANTTNKCRAGAHQAPINNLGIDYHQYCSSSARCVFFHFFFATSLPDCCQIGGDPMPDFFSPDFQISKKSGMGYRYPVPDSGKNFQIARLCQILATDSYVALTQDKKED
jgi:hypothetical protein